MSGLSATTLPVAPDNATLTIAVNGVPKVVHRSWLVEGGRAAGSALARLILGTTEGLGGSDAVHVEAGHEAFDSVCGWLEFGDSHMLAELTPENAGALLETAGYLC